MVSFNSRMTFDLAQRYSAAIAERVMAKDAAMSGQLFVHTGGNYRTRTTIAPYSPRARPGFPIAAPVDDPDVNLCGWDGEPLDYDEAVDAMCAASS